MFAMFTISNCTHLGEIIEKKKKQKQKTQPLGQSFSIDST
jgi:hypothetical protein